MPLNYSKWDQLELSDDSDIEGHPNVDKKSLIRWKQRDIHEKREVRKQKIAHLQAQIACNKVLFPRIQDIYARLSAPSDSSPSVYFNTLYEQLQKNPSPDCPPGNDSQKIEQTYDGMLLELLTQVSAQAKDKIKDASVLESEKEDKLSKALIDGMKFHVDHLGETIKKDEAELVNEEQEQKKHITSDDLHDGFSNKYVPPKPDPSPVPIKKINTPKTKTTTTTEFETLNPAASGSTLPSSTEEDDAALPELTPTLAEFSKIPYQAFEKSFEFIQRHRDVIVPGASDALLVAAFKAEGEGKKKLAKQCVHQSLLLQYCEKLGGDGVRVFFQKMISGDKRAERVFIDDVEKTYAHLCGRVEKSKEEEALAGGKEQIQLVPESPDQTISFNVPSGPPPENIVLEGPGTEGMDIEEVRKALQFRWEVFSSFPENLRKALESGSLDSVNQVLADMEVEEAEGVVQNLDMAGILNFAEGGIRDETGNLEED